MCYTIRMELPRLTDHTDLRTLVDTLHSSSHTMPVDVASQALLALSGAWGNFVYIPGYDQVVENLIGAYDHPLWRHTCATYLVPCLEELLDELNTESAVWRFHSMLHTLGPVWTTLPMQSPWLTHWRDIATNDVPPVTMSDQLLHVLLSEQTPDVFGDQVMHLLDTGVIALPSMSDEIVSLCARLSATDTVRPGTDSFTRWGVQLACAGFRDWGHSELAPSYVAHGRDGFLKMTVLLQAASDNPLLRCYALGLLNYRLMDIDSTYAHAVHLFVASQHAWLKDHADIALTAYAIEEQRHAGHPNYGTHFIWQEVWLEAWDMQHVGGPSGHRFQSKPLPQYKQDRDLLWVLKPAWACHHATFDALELTFSEAIAYGFALEQEHVVTAVSLALPAGLSL